MRASRKTIWSAAGMLTAFAAQGETLYQQTGSRWRERRGSKFGRPVSVRCQRSTIPRMYTSG